MLFKFETKSTRVKGLSFHPKRPWILASLHDGMIQLWDYRMGALVDRFVEHEGPVRGIDFHPQQPLFVSGGDDYKIKVWNFKMRRCLFTLLGHLDYIRTVQVRRRRASSSLVRAPARSADATADSRPSRRNARPGIEVGARDVAAGQRSDRGGRPVGPPGGRSVGGDGRARASSVFRARRARRRPHVARRRGAPMPAESTQHSVLDCGGVGVGVGVGGPWAVDEEPCLPPSFALLSLLPRLTLLRLPCFLSSASPRVLLAVRLLLLLRCACLCPQFHRENPWIVSASDDQTIRIWNWQSRSCISVLTGHNHYVMCAQFHPSMDLIVSASLDQTVRVWDTLGLRKKTVRSTPSDDYGAGGRSGAGGDLFGADAVVKYVLEGHERGVNWASFHPTSPLIVSGADDQRIKLWRMNDSRAWEVDSLKGHMGNVSCVLFHPRRDFVVSNSEDRTTRLWDASKRLLIQLHRRERDRFWVLAAHPEQDLLATGHDSGLIVFKFQRERPAYAPAGDGLLFWVKDRYLRRCVLGTGADVPIATLRRPTTGIGQYLNPRTLTVNPFNPSEESVVIHPLGDDGSYELYNLNSAEGPGVRGTGLAVAFLGRDRLVVLDGDRRLSLRTLDRTHEVKKTMDSPYATPDALFNSSTAGRVLVRSDDRIALFETQSRRVIGEVTSVRVRYVVWNREGSLVALLGKDTIVIADRNLKPICSLHETVRIKGAAWDEHGVLVYTTVMHIKYLLPNEKGDAGIVRTLDAVVYPVDARNATLFALDREGVLRTIRYDATEYLFKQALASREYARVLELIRTGNMCGHAVIAYLQKSGYPEVALHFVDDPSTRFGLALECGNLDVARDCATAVNKPEFWHRLATEALRQGNLDVVETAYQQTRNAERLSFLYLLTGHRENLAKMLAASQRNRDVMARFHNALFLGDASERLKVLESAGQIALAYATALTYHLDDDVARLRTAFADAQLALPDLRPFGIEADGSPSEGAPRPIACLPPTPIVAVGNWPLLHVRRSPFDTATLGSSADARAAGSGSSASSSSSTGGPGVSATASSAAAALSALGAGGADAAAWGGDDLDLGLDGGAAASGGGRGPDGAGGGDGKGTAAWGGEDLDLDLGEIEDPALALGATGAGGGGAGGAVGGFDRPKEGVSFSVRWAEAGDVAGELVAAGAFERALGLLNRQVGLVNAAPLQSRFLAAYTAARASLPTLPTLASVAIPLGRAPATGPGAASSAPLAGGLRRPTLLVTLASLVNKLKDVYRHFQAGAFPEAQDALDDLLASLPLCVVDTKAEELEIKELLAIAREYKTAVAMELERKALPETSPPARRIELAAYLTHCALQPAHLLLALNLAMSFAFKHQNFITAAGFARRIVEMPEAANPAYAALVQKARKVLSASEAQARNAHVLQYDERNPFVLCCGSFTPIYRGSPSIRSALCGAHYKPEFRGQVCRIDGMSAVGVETLGLVVRSAGGRSATAAASGGGGGGGAGGGGSRAPAPAPAPAADDEW